MSLKKSAELLHREFFNANFFPRASSSPLPSPSFVPHNHLQNSLCSTFLTFSFSPANSPLQFSPCPHFPCVACSFTGLSPAHHSPSLPPPSLSLIAVPFSSHFSVLLSSHTNFTAECLQSAASLRAEETLT